MGTSTCAKKEAARSAAAHSSAAPQPIGSAAVFRFFIIQNFFRSGGPHYPSFS